MAVAVVTVKLPMPVMSWPLPEMAPVKVKAATSVGSKVPEKV